MRKLDKSKILSTKYEKWVQELDKKRKKHPIPKTNQRYFYDVVMNLLHCQKGLCAYTECSIVDPQLLTEDKWENGTYKNNKPQRFGHLEHFNPNLKTEKGYQWDNLFVAFSDINVLKGRQKVDKILNEFPYLKPDSAKYDPMKLLAYDTMTHCFYPNPYIDDENLKNRIRDLLKLLQVNHSTICFYRKKFVKAGLENHKSKKYFDVYQYITACRMVGIPVEDD